MIPAHRIEALVSARVAFVVATVVRAAKPTSVRPGDAAVVLPDGTIDGFVGGVCAQASVRLHAARALETGEAVLLRLLPGAGEDDVTDGVVVAHNPCLSGGSLETSTASSIDGCSSVLTRTRAPTSSSMSLRVRVAKPLMSNFTS